MPNSSVTKVKSNATITTATTTSQTQNIAVQSAPRPTGGTDIEYL